MPLGSFGLYWGLSSLRSVDRMRLMGEAGNQLPSLWNKSWKEWRKARVPGKNGRGEEPSAD